MEARRIVELYEKFEMSIVAIANAPGLTHVPEMAVRRTLNMAGVAKRRGGHKPGIPRKKWDELKKLLEAGWTRADIADHFRVSEGVVKSTISRMNGNAPKNYIRGVRREKKKERVCLKCDKKFMSAGIHNRLCPNCRESNENVGPLTDQMTDGCRHSGQRGNTNLW